MSTITMLRHDQLEVVSNARFGLKPYRTKELAEDIAAVGEVHTPLRVFPLEEKPNKYGIVFGHYRHAAVAQLAKEGTEILLPCTVEPRPEDLERLRFQVSENNSRESLSPMDMAVAIRELLDKGLPKVEIRKLFPRPGGRKGAVSLDELSNASLNIYLSFLDFPKDIQKKIHDGFLGVAQAYKLSRLPSDKWQPVVDQAVADWEKERDDDTKLETRFLEEQRKASEAEAKAKADKEAAIVAEKLAKDSREEADKRRKEAADAAAAAQLAKGKEAKAKATEALKAKEAAAAAAEKAATSAQSTHEKLSKKVEEANTKAAARRKQLEDARKAAASTKKLDTDKAAQKITGEGKVKLKGPEMYKYIHDIATLPSAFPKASWVCKAILAAFDSEITDTQLLAELAWLTGERKEKPKHLGKGSRQ